MMEDLQNTQVLAEGTGFGDEPDKQAAILRVRVANWCWFGWGGGNHLGGRAIT